MATIQNSIDFALPFIEYSPLSVGTANQPAVGIANIIQFMITSAPFTWGWNRNEDNSKTTIPGIQDYTIGLTDFAFLEKVSLTDSNGTVFIVQDVYNTAALAVADTSTNQRARPNSACVVSGTYGTSIKVRFIAVPDKAYVINLTYQKLVVPMTTLTGSTGTWLIPDQYQDIYNNLFVGEAMAIVDDPRSVQYRQRGISELLAKAEGLTEMQKNLFLEQYWMRSGRADMVGALRAQQGNAARGV